MSGISADDLTLALVVTEGMCAALMLPWAVAYLLFPRAVARVLEAIGAAAVVPRRHLQEIARFVWWCGVAHLVLAAFSSAMVAGMLAAPLVGWPASLVIFGRAAALVPLVIGGLISVRAVVVIRVDLGLAPIAWRDLWPRRGDG